MHLSYSCKNIHIYQRDSLCFTTSFVITIGHKLEMISSKDHETCACRLDALLLVKNVQLPSFLRLFQIYLGIYFHYLELIMLVSRIKLMTSGGIHSSLGYIRI